MSSYYINTDVDIESLQSLQRLKEFLDKRACLLFGEPVENGTWSIRIEADGSGIIGSEDHSPESDIEKLCVLLKEAKSLFPIEFKDLIKFDFNIGWQSSSARPEGAFTINNHLISEIAVMGATISVTIYPSDELD